MKKCTVCKGNKKCKGCGGTGSGKQANPHPQPWNVKGDGEVVCSECKGTGKCVQCDGTGVENSTT